MTPCALSRFSLRLAGEAASIPNLYQNPICNIGASVAPSSGGGLFHARDVELVRFQDFINDKGAYIIIWPKLSYGSIDSAPLYKRGWLIEERWLCPPMLQFGADQIIWEC